MLNTVTQTETMLQRNRNWQLHHWRGVIFYDETKVPLGKMHMLVCRDDRAYNKAAGTERG